MTIAAKNTARQHGHASLRNRMARMAGDGRKTSQLRLSRLVEELEKWAADELRSVNGQIEYPLREALAKRKGGAKTPDDS